MYARKNTRCMVTGCRKEAGEYVTYHEYPSDPVCRAKWIKALKVNRDEKEIMCEEVTRSDCVCSKHFLLSDYRPTGKRRYLLRHAVPSQFPKYRKSSKSKVDEKKTKNHKSPKSKHGPVPEEIYHSLLDGTSDEFEDIELLDIDLDFEDLETINFDDSSDGGDNDDLQHIRSIAIQTDPILEVEQKSVSVQVDADLSRERRQIFLLQQKNNTMADKIKNLSKELAEERSKSKLQLKVIEKLKKGSTLFQINRQDKKEM